ncbi:baseplate assembly protein [Pseudoduganella sp. FT55W]|uniref:Baseplate assembly protein n=1 Tax=Duganella rivi TaxID=2666083 RepID=A0A7X4GWW0_9BURK|nr:GPW/gp25 family protein [Duganella rivi]MYM70534.1 baseplate assembly protein [Duganella rivi]
MIGMDAKTGRSLQGLAHLYQSIGKVLTTPEGSCVARRTFGSKIFSLIDAPNNPATRVRLYAAAATALMKWEPRLKLTRVSISGAPSMDGKQSLDIEGTTRISGELVNTSVSLSAERTV